MTTKAIKNAKGGGTIRKRSDGRWEARYTLGMDPKTGKQIQKSVYGKTQKEVRQKLTAITAEIDDGTYQEPCRMTLDEWLDIWLRDYLTGAKPSTAYLYQLTCINGRQSSISVPRWAVCGWTGWNPIRFSGFTTLSMRNVTESRPCRRSPSKTSTASCTRHCSRRYC